MRVAIGSDEKNNLTEFIISELKRLGHEPVCHGPMAGEALQWPHVAARVAAAVQSGNCKEGILLCWTGTGVCIAANKLRGIRAALCGDAYTANGARRWNDANILALSLRNTSEAIAKEILEQWFAPVSLQDEDRRLVAYLTEMEKENK